MQREIMFSLRIAPALMFPACRQAGLRLEKVTHRTRSPKLSGRGEHEYAEIAQSF
jgi:hypothetical protein